ncbi:Caltractin [Stylophora pistillata]|uniref:Caltractin n=1 Tax=Stylophora pistillata TaxID=50429 RepID=A0A2B4SAD7_STYPI|nr:Caltractin [Stylophora pistillata]
MQKTQRNAFALGKKEEAIAVPEPPPQFSHGTVTFDMVPSSAEDLQYELSERATPCPTLTDEQVTGRERTSVGTVISLGFTSAFREVFDLFDSNGGGTIDAEELDLALKSVEIHLSQEELQEVLSAMDKDGNGEIDFHEFLNLMTNTERFLEEFASVGERRKRENLLIEALTQFMKRSALHSINEIVGQNTKPLKITFENVKPLNRRFYHTKYKRIQAPHVVGHYAAGARVIGLTENQLRRRLESLKARHAAGDNKSPYAEPLHIVFGTGKMRRHVTSRTFCHKVCGKYRRDSQTAIKRLRMCERYDDEAAYFQAVRTMLSYTS